MKNINEKHYIWAEKYRPTNLEDIILPEKTKNQIKSFLKDGDLPNLLFSSVSPGLGKSTLVYCIINELGSDVLWINGSRDSGIEMTRNKISNFATSASILGNSKIVVIDEADGLNGGAQQALRGIIEEYAKNTRFILTCNYKEKIIEPLLNRLIQINFDEIFHNNKKEIGKQIYKRLQFILNNEGVKYKEEDLKNVLVSFYPSVRKMILILQQCVRNQVLELDENLISETSLFEEILEQLKKQNFSTIRGLINELSNPEYMYSFINKHIETYFEEKSIPYVILYTAKYLDMSQRSRDKQITLSAYFVELLNDERIKLKD